MEVYVMRTVIKIFLEVFNFLFNRDWFFSLIGELRLIESIFLAYPANEKYALAYASRKRVQKEKWTPWITGFLVQDRKIGLMFSISATEKDFLKKDNHDHLKEVTKKMEDIRSTLKAKHKTFAGILQGLLYKRGLINRDEVGLTSEFIYDAVNQIQIKEMVTRLIPIIIIGGNGFIGKQLNERFSNNRQVYSVDIKDAIPNIPEAIVINVANRKSISKHLENIHPKMVLVNEVYPEPSRMIIKKMKEKGLTCYHIMGAEAKCFPNFPGAYKGAIPCCAAWRRGNSVVKKIC
jgi:hypothetical protein